MEKALGAGYRGVLVLLLRLRQCCRHLHLSEKGMIGSDSGMEDRGLESAIEAMTESNPIESVIDLPAEYSQTALSSKVSLMMTVLEDIFEEEKENDHSCPYKYIIVSQWTTMLQIVGQHLDANSISHTTIDGSVPPKLRQDVVARFNAPSPHPRVMLLALQAGGVGLNLIGGVV